MFTQHENAMYLSGEKLAQKVVNDRKVLAYATKHGHYFNTNIDTHILYHAYSSSGIH